MSKIVRLSIPEEIYHLAQRQSLTTGRSIEEVLRIALGAWATSLRDQEPRPVAPAVQVGAAKYTRKQGQYLAFIHHYTKLHGQPPAETDMAAIFQVTPPSVHQMVVKLDERGLISRVPGQARTIRVLLPPDQLPDLE